MKNKWLEKEAQKMIVGYKSAGGDLALRTYSARLIGNESSLVLHGGGNTSVKTDFTTIMGEKISMLCIKGSGWDLGSIEPAGHPAVKLEALQNLRQLLKLSDEDMVNELRANMLDSSGPNPSVEALLHAFLPHKYIDHTHADAVLALMNQPHAEQIAKRLAGRLLAFVPYIMPGFALAKLAAQIYEGSPHVEGLLLHKHGIFTFGSTAEESYGRMIKWVTAAEKFISKNNHHHSFGKKISTDPVLIAQTSHLLRRHFANSKKRWIVRFRTSPNILRFLDRSDLSKISQQGPATPDHVIRTKSLPLILKKSAFETRETLDREIETKINSYAKSYRQYFDRQSKKNHVTRKILDQYPRIILAPGLGLFSVAANAKAADIALDIYEHTIKIIENAEQIGTYQALPEKDLFDMEYWSLEQAKLGKEKSLPFDGHIVWISGAAAGIGLATAKAFADLGAHVFAVDLKEANSNTYSPRIVGDACDVTKPDQVKKSFNKCSQTFGGVDIVVSNAGIAPISPIEKVEDSVLRKSFEVNFFAHQTVAQTASEVLMQQGLGGCLLFNASKSAFNPGPEFGPYTLPKTAVIGLMKQYAVELGRFGIRSNAVNADRINTGLYTDGLLAKRAKARGVSVQTYLSGNLLGQEVLAEDVARGFIHLALSQKTTGATLPVDGGNAAAFPR